LPTLSAWAIWQDPYHHNLIAHLPTDIAAVYPGPYLCYYPLPTPELVRSAHEYIVEVIDEDGPIDAIISFSQGAALAASIFLQHAKEKPHEDLVALAVFISASLLFDLDDETGADIWRSTQENSQSFIAASSDPALQSLVKQVPVCRASAIAYRALQQENAEYNNSCRGIRFQEVLLFDNN
jgi:hypothetical protein